MNETIAANEMQDRKLPQGGSSTAPPIGQRGVTDADLQRWFTYHKPAPEQFDKYVAIRQAGMAMARVILASTPASADQTAAIRKVREAVYTANAAIACEGR